MKDYVILWLHKHDSCEPNIFTFHNLVRSSFIILLTPVRAHPLRYPHSSDFIELWSCCKIIIFERVLFAHGKCCSTYSVRVTGSIVYGGSCRFGIFCVCGCLVGWGEHVGFHVGLLWSGWSQGPVAGWVYSLCLFIYLFIFFNVCFENL